MCCRYGLPLKYAAKLALKSANFDVVDISMLSFNNLGKLGRLGNQMFQYAALLCIAKRTGYEFCIPRLNGKDEYGGYQLSAAFNLPSLKIIGWLKTLKMVQPSTFSYDAQLAEHCENNVDLFGYFQTERLYAKNSYLLSPLRAIVASSSDVLAVLRSACTYAGQII